MAQTGPTGTGKLLPQTHSDAFRSDKNQQSPSEPNPNPPHGDAIFGVVEPLQSPEEVGQRVRAVTGDDRHHHGRKPHFGLLRRSFLRKVAPGSGNQGPEQQQAESEHGGSRGAGGRVSSPGGRKRGRGEERKGIPKCSPPLLYIPYELAHFFPENPSKPGGSADGSVGMSLSSKHALWETVYHQSAQQKCLKCLK